VAHHEPGHDSAETGGATQSGATRGHRDLHDDAYPGGVSTQYRGQSDHDGIDRCRPVGRHDDECPAERHQVRGKHQDSEPHNESAGRRAADRRNEGGHELDPEAEQDRHREGSRTNRCPQDGRECQQEDPGRGRHDTEGQTGHRHDPLLEHEEWTTAESSDRHQQIRVGGEKNATDERGGAHGARTHDALQEE
jgi:hypothetical protein